MNITLTSSQLSGLSFATAKRNAANPNSAPMTNGEFAADLLGAQLDSFEAERFSAVHAELASNERLMALGIAVAAQLDKLGAVEAAVTDILNS